MLRQPLIDGFEFARAGSRLSGEWPVSAFARMRSALHSESGTIHYEVQGVPQGHGRPALRLRVEGSLDLTCQRCLGPLEHRVAADVLLVLYEREADLGQLPVDADSPERVVAGKEMSVRDMVEDEMLLSIPYAPRHEQCAPQPGLPKAVRQTPFSGLRGMLGGKR